MFREYLQRFRTARVDGGSAYKVTLTRSTPFISLVDQGAATGNLRINLSWRMRSTDPVPADRGSLLRHPFRLFEPVTAQSHGPALVNVDLDLACMYELADGTKGVVQPLGEFFGSLSEPPYISLSGDDRSGGGSGEDLYVNLDQKDNFRRLLFFAYIYDNTPAFDRTAAVVTMFPSVGPRIEVRLDEHAAEARCCAVALIDNRRGKLTVRREVKYVYGFQAELDRLYGWGMQWARGRKKG